MTEMSRYNLGVTFFKTLIARSNLINFLITGGGFLWLSRTVCHSQLNLASDRLLPSKRQYNFYAVLGILCTLNLARLGT